MCYNLKYYKKTSLLSFYTCILTMFIQFGNLVAQTTIPDNVIIRDYPLNDAQVNDVKNNKDGVKHGSFEAVKNRLGYPQGALKINSNSYVELPNFFEETEVSNGYSVSFWMKVDDPTGPPSGVLPYLNTDKRDGIFFARKGSITAGTNLFGMTRVRDRLVVNRYIPLKNPNPELEFWLWDPVNLDTSPVSGNDWHFVSLVYTKNAMQVYIGKPDGSFNCRANYFAPQDLSQVTFWGLGNPNGSSIGNLDDFKVYSIPLTKEQVRGVFEAERPFNLSNTYKLIPKHSNNPLTINIQHDNGDDFLMQDTPKDILAQNWFFKPEGGGAFSIQNSQSGFNLTSVSDALASKIKQTNFGTGSETGSDQKWEIKYGGKTSQGKDYFRIVNLLSNNKYSLSINYGRTTPGEKAVMWPQHNGDDQKYYIERVPSPITTIVNDGEYYIMNKKKVELFMKVGFGSYETIELDRLLNTPHEPEATPWKVKYKGNGKYLISTDDVDGIDEKVIDLMPNVLQPTMNSFLKKKTQYWRFIKMGDSDKEQLPYYKIVNYQHSDLILAPQNHYSDKAPIETRPYLDNQDINYWYLVPKSYFILKNDEYQIVPKHNSKSSLVMSDKGTFKAIYTKDKNSFFNWNITRLPTGEYHIKNNGRYLKDITNYDNNENPNSSNLKLVNENPKAYSYYFKWTLRKRKTENGINYYTISNHGKGVLEVENESKNYSARIVKKPYEAGKESQLWSFSKYNNKKCIDARPVYLGQSVYGATSNFPITYQQIEKCSYAPGGNRSVVWYRLTGKIQQGTRVTVTTCNDYTNFNTILAIYKGSSTCGLMECVTGDAYNSSFCNTPNKYSKSSVTFSVLDMEKDYYIAVYGDGKTNSHDGKTDDLGDFQLDVSTSPLPLKVPEEKALSITKDSISTDDNINHNISIGNLYPNPTSKSVSVDIFAKNTSKVNINISDMGQLIVLKNEFDLKTGKNLLNLNLSSISYGIYIVEFNIGDYKTFRKLIIK